MSNDIKPINPEPPPNLKDFVQFFFAAVQETSTIQKVFFMTYAVAVIAQVILPDTDWMSVLTNFIVLAFWGIAILNGYIIDLYKKENDLLREYLNRMNAFIDRFFAGVEGKN